jgi:class 3 adenylate cyclase/CHASE2 domain-containing sensor protein
MKPTGQSWLATPNVSWKWVSAAVLIWGTAFFFICKSDLGDYLDSRIARPIDFRSRDWLGKTPERSEQLKILSIDDSTFSKLGKSTLTLDQWHSLFRTIAENKPRAIVVDGMFSMANSEDSDLGPLIEGIKNVGVPIIVGGFVVNSEINFRKPLRLDRPEYNIAKMIGAASIGDVKEDEVPKFSRALNWKAYGPAIELQNAFSQVGHFVYLDGRGKVSAAFLLDQNSAIAHLSLYAANEMKISQGRLTVDGHVVPIDDRGEVVVNFLPPRELRQLNKSLKGLLDISVKGEKSKSINEGDIVLILPMMFTGHTDFKVTPFGHQPGGYIIASMLNSVLTGQWIKTLKGTEFFVFIFAFLGAFIGMRMRSSFFWMSMIGGFVVWFIVSAYAFSWHSIEMAWFFPAAAFFSAGITVFAEKTRVSEKKVQALKHALEGAVAPNELKNILKKPELINLEARERVVTLMFIDVVGFSLLAENMLPRMAFENLKKMLSKIGDTVHEFGGIIDKTLGDGLLCYFGYSFTEDSTFPDHAEKALRCAIRIQKDSLQSNLEASENGEPVYPLRIGINTSSCYLGDLGNSSRIDFTVVGNGVNFAKRLEGACEMHSVLMGATTYDLVKGIGLNSEAVAKRFIRIKHHSELVESYEYDPFIDQIDLRIAAIEGFRKCANIERIDQRWPVQDPAKIQLDTDFGKGELVNFSHGGLSIRLPHPLVKGTRFNVTLDSAGGVLGNLLKAKNISVLQAEVRWGYTEDNQFVHGVMISNVTEAESDYLVQYLCEFAFTRDVKNSISEAS